MNNDLSTSPQFFPDSHLGAARTDAPDAQGNATLVPNEAAGYLMLDEKRWNLLYRQCEVLVQGGALHRTIDTPAKAMVLAMKAIEMGVPLTSAWSGMRIIEGEITIVGKLALRMIQQRALPRGAVCRRLPVDPDEVGVRAGWMMGRPDSEPQAYWFTMDMARTAGLLRMQTKSGEWIDTPAYKNYPDRMLSWRALAMGAAFEFADIMQGCLFAEEMNHKDQQFINAQLRAAQTTNRSSPRSREEISRHRTELDSKHPDMQSVSALLHKWVLTAQSISEEPDDIPEGTWYGRMRRDKWRDLSTRCIKGKAATQPEALQMQEILADETRQLKEQQAHEDASSQDLEHEGDEQVADEQEAAHHEESEDDAQSVRPESADHRPEET